MSRIVLALESSRRLSRSELNASLSVCLGRFLSTDAEYRALKQKAEADQLEARLSGKEPLPTEPSTPLIPSPDLESSLTDVFDTVLNIKDEDGEPEGLLSVSFPLLA